MTTGLGVDPTKNGSGVITSGMSALDMRKVNGALYTPGIISGCLVTTSASALTYTVDAGVVAIATATSPYNIVLAPVPATVKTVTAPPSGVRTDIVYATQHFPADGDSEVIVDVGTILPANSVELMRFTIGVGVGNTNAATRIGTTNYSIPYGGTLPILHYFEDSYNGVLPNAISRRGYGTFSVPTDRRLRFSLSATLYAQNAVRFDNNNYCEYYFLPNIDGGDMQIWTTPGLHQAWATYTWEAFVNVAAGVHTCNFGLGRMVGPGNAATFTGTDGSGFGRKSFVFRVQDEGVIV